MLRGLFVIALFMSGALLTAHADLTAQQLADRLDFVRRPTQSFEVKLTITELRNGKQEQQSVLHVMARKHPEDIRFDAVGLCQEPEADKGKSIFAGDKEMWFFDPKSKHPSRISPSHFKGKFFLSDALSASFSADYDSELDGEETIPDASHQNVPCVKLKMKRREKGGTAPDVIEYWIDKKLLHPIRGEFFTATAS